jgi:hypothetical protein
MFNYTGEDQLTATIVLDGMWFKPTIYYLLIELNGTSPHYYHEQNTTFRITAQNEVNFGYANNTLYSDYCVLIYSIDLIVLIFCLYSLFQLLFL